MPTVSVVIPTYNRLPLVLRAIHSVCRQTFRDLEIIVVDDGSSDGTREQLTRLAERLPELRERLVYERFVQNRGANPARNAAVRLARGEYLAFLDSDDLWHPRKLERQLAARDAGPLFSYTGRFRVDGDHRVIARQLPSAALVTERHLRTCNTIGPLSAVLVSTAVARGIGGFDETLPASQDWDFYLRAVPHCRVVGVREPLLMYYDAGAQRISRDSRRRLQSHLAMYRKHMRGRVSQTELGAFYRNVAEDLEGLARTALARRFFFMHTWLLGEPLAALRLALSPKPLAIRERRYAEYARAEAARRDKDRDAAYLEAFAELLSAPLGQRYETDPSA